MGQSPKAVNNLCSYIWEMFTKVPAWASLGLAQASHGLVHASQGLAWDPLDMAPACQRPRFGLHRPGSSLPLPRLGPLATQFPAWAFHGLVWACKGLAQASKGLALASMGLSKASKDLALASEGLALASLGLSPAL